MSSPHLTRPARIPTLSQWSATGVASGVPGHSFVVLDAMRGVAAVAVMLYHFSSFLSQSTVLPGAYRAVDLFFVLSGFVLCHAYGARLESGSLGFGRYVLLRLVRLYPLYIAGTLLGLAYLSGRDVLRADADGRFLAALALGLAFVPNFWGSGRVSGLFPFDPAAWSLFFELVISVVYGAIAPYLRLPRLGILLTVSLVALLVAAWSFTSLDLGMTRRTLAGGTARVVFSFFAGVALYHLYRRRRWAWRVPPWALMSVLTIIFAIQCPGVWNTVFDCVAVVLLFPAVILLGAGAVPDLPRLAGWLGRLSYPVYVLHTPLLLLCAGAWKWLLHSDPSQHIPQAGLSFAAVTVLASAIALRGFDEPTRAWLKLRLARRSGR